VHDRSANTSIVHICVQLTGCALRCWLACGCALHQLVFCLSSPVMSPSLQTHSWPSRQTQQTETKMCLTLQPPAVKTQCLSQCQAFQRLVRSSHTLFNWILNNFWSTTSIFNQFSVFLKILNALCVCLQYKHPRSIKRVIRSDKPLASVFLVKSQKCDFGAEPRFSLFATSAGKGLNQVSARNCFFTWVH
jgi:hypothetical protein